MEDSWLKWKGKKVFVRLKTGKVYSGHVINVDIEVPIFITLLDKFHKYVLFSIGEILEIKEENY